MSALALVASTLVTRWSALSALVGVVVFSGPPVGDPSAGDYLFIGDDSDPTTDVVSTFTQTWIDMAHTRRTEIGEIMCAMVSDSGDTDMTARQSRAFTLLAACEADLISDPTLGGVTYMAELVIGQSMPLQNASGSASVVPFTVRYGANL
jgi:hypothetical protein